MAIINVCYSKTTWFTLRKKKSYFVLVGSVATKNNSSKGFDATNMEKVPA